MKKFFILAAAAISFAACSNNESDNQVQNPDNAIRLNASVGTTTRAASNIYGGGTNFDAGTTVKVQVTDQAASNAVTYEAIDYTVGAAGALTGESTQYYPAGGSNVNIYAYYPSNATTTFTVTADQSDDAAYKASDLMYASITGINKNSDAAARTLTFDHLLSKITVVLVKGTGMTDEEMARATVMLNDVIIKGTFTAASGTFAAAADETANKSDMTIGTGAGSHSAIVVPQSVAGKTLTVTIDNTDQTYTFGTGISFAAAENNIYTLTLNKTGIEVTYTIGNWGDGSTGSETLTY